jgi:hypothetical protein
MNKFLLPLGIFATLTAPAFGTAENSNWIDLQKKNAIERNAESISDRLFEKSWTNAEGEIVDPIEKNGFKFGIGSRMNVIVDGRKKGEGILLGRLVSSEFRTVAYLFQDGHDRKNYIIPVSKCSLTFDGRTVKNAEIQSVAATMTQEGENCSELATVNYFAQLVQSGHRGNGTLRKELEHPEGWIKLLQYAERYYTASRGAGNFKPILERLGEMYGYKCHSLEVVSAPYLEKTVASALSAGIPVLLEFYIGNEMVNSSRQWFDTSEMAGEDVRFWAPRAVGQRNGGGHALVAVGTFISGSNRENLLINDSDWRGRPVEWDYNTYFAKRISSSGMMAHYCE